MEGMHTPTRPPASERYPTYQLRAHTSIGRPEEQLLRCVNILYEWLTARFDRQSPEEREALLPPVKNPASVGELTSWGWDAAPFHLDLCWLPEQRAWAMQLVEPDMGYNIGTSGGRPPVNGRTFTTHVSMVSEEDRLQIGCRIMVSQPADVGRDCEEVRPGFVRTMVMDKRVGLFHCGKLQYEAHDIDSREKVRDFYTCCRDTSRILPLILVCERLPNLRKLPVSLPRLMNTPPGITLPSVLPEETQPFPVEELAHDCMGYAQVFRLRAAWADTMTREMKIKALTPGEVVVFEPLPCGGGINRRSWEDYCASVSREKKILFAYIRRYATRKPYAFDQLIFVPRARGIEADIRLRSRSSLEEAEKQWKSKLENQRLDFEDEMLRQKQKLNDAEERCRRAEKRWDQEQRERKKERSRWEAERKAATEELAKRDTMIAYLRSREERPDRLADVADWAVRFSGRLRLLPRAVGELKKADPHHTDLPLLCDALEYLAGEYLERLRKQLTEEQALEICRWKYNRSFTVSPVNGTSVTMYHEDYFVAVDGRERQLDLHLRVGNQAANMLRIYFFYDTEAKELVVGSLPEHLRTDSYS